MNTGKIPQGMTAITPMLTVKDVDQAVEFYERAFGLTKKFAMPGPDGKTMHAEVMHGGGSIMLGPESDMCGTAAPEAGAKVTASLFLYVEDVDAFFEHAVAQGATAMEKPNDMPWGDRMCALVDPFGHRWSFGTHVKEVAPEEIQKAIHEQMKAMSPA